MQRAVFRSLLKSGKLASCLSGNPVRKILKQFGNEYSGHIARHRLLTASAEKGTSLHIINKHSRHKSADMVLRYIDDAKGFEDSAVTGLECSKLNICPTPAWLQQIRD